MSLSSTSIVAPYVIMGITGQVGGTAARTLLAAGAPVRAVVRSLEKGQPWVDQGCEVAVANIFDPEALAAAFTGAAGVFLMMPPDYDPEPGFPEIKKILAAVTAAVEKARPAKLAFLSTVGAQVAEPNLLNNSRLMEAGLRKLHVPMAFLRAAWFMENASWDVASARAGVIRSFLQPFDHAIPMVSADDIGCTVSDLLGETWNGTRVVELQAPRRYSATDIAAAFAAALGCPVRLEAVPRDTWETLFRAQGMKNPQPRIRMLDGFNEGWIDFEGSAAESRWGEIPLEAVIRKLLDRRS